jgi:hypothetical protein
MPFSDVDAELTATRKRIFEILLRRLRQLHSSRQPPVSFYVGEPYVEDKDTVECMIAANFIFTGVVPPFEFWKNGARISGTQHQNVLVIRIYRRISRKLWDDLKYLKRGEQFIVGYLAACMPRLNRTLIDNRYDQGHLLSRTFAVFEATKICVIVRSELVWINWPIAFAAFPPSAEIASKADALFVRDLIDAMGSYFRGEFDDCIRRLITSTENFIETNGWNVQTIPNGWIQNLLRLTPRRARFSFRQSLKRNLERTMISGEVIYENMRVIYSTRNKIVHAGFRMSTSSALFCSKAIGTVYYLIYRYSGNRTISRYVYTLHTQFKLQCNALGEYDLDQIKKLFGTSRPETSVIDSDEALENAMFSSLRYTERDKHSISH